MRFPRKTEALCGLLSKGDGNRTDIIHSEGMELAHNGCLSVLLLHSLFGPVCRVAMSTVGDGFTSSVVLLHTSLLSVNTLVDITKSVPYWFPKHHLDSEINLHESASPRSFPFLRLWAL